MKYFNAIIFIALVMSGMYSCKPDSKDQPVPADPKLRFIASWKCNEMSSQTGPSAFDVHIVDSTGDYVLIENFSSMGFNNKVKAHISGDNINFIVPQNISGKVILSASAHLENSSTIKMNYIVDYGNPQKDTCSATLTKQ